MTCEQPNEQTKAALDIFIDIYGFPAWETNPKEGQSKSQIIHVWNEALQGYSVEQIEEAAFHIVRSQKSMRFPTISHLRSYLFDKEKEGRLKEQLAEIQRKLSMPRVETDPIRKRAGNFYVNGRKVLYGAYEWCAGKVLRDVQAQYPKLEGYTALVRKADALGWLDNGRIIDYIYEHMGWDKPAASQPEDFDTFKSIGNCFPSGWEKKD